MGMINGILAATNAVLIVGVPLLLVYVHERIKTVAHEASARTLADYKHEHDREMSSLRAFHQMSLQRFGLYTTRQHRVYARLYGYVRKATDQYGWFFLMMGPDFNKFTLEDVAAYREQHKLRQSDIEPIEHALRTADGTASDLLTELDEKVHRRDANHTFQRVKNYEALNELYLSDAVREKMDSIRRQMAALFVAVLRPQDLDERTKGYEKHRALDSSVTELYKIMRGELQRGSGTPE